jgi:hypothetical protein
MAYKARHLPTGQLVCVKTLRAPEGCQAAQADALRGQRREVAVLAALRLHPNIIRRVRASLQRCRPHVGTPARVRTRAHSLTAAPSCRAAVLLPGTTSALWARALTRGGCRWSWNWRTAGTWLQSLRATPGRAHA